MRRAAALAAIFAAAVVVAGCGGPVVVRGGPAITWQHPITTAAPTPTAPPGLSVLPPSSDVTGTYPAHCAAGADAGSHAVPDPSCTPGAVRADVTEANIDTNICVRGWTATVRPPEAETGPVKVAAMSAYGEAANTRGTTELDHLVPLELGGSNDVSNLWPQPSDEPGHGFNNTKDTVENDLKTAVCSHKVQLSDAQRAIAVDWSTAEHVVGIQ